MSSQEWLSETGVFADGDPLLSSRWNLLLWHRVNLLFWVYFGAGSCCFVKWYLSARLQQRSVLVCRTSRALFLASFGFTSAFRWHFDSRPRTICWTFPGVGNVQGIVDLACQAGFPNYVVTPREKRTSGETIKFKCLSEHFPFRAWKNSFACVYRASELIFIWPWSFSQTPS
jgi:hypothetical protein